MNGKWAIQRRLFVVDGLTGDNFYHIDLPDKIKSLREFGEASPFYGKFVDLLDGCNNLSNKDFQALWEGGKK